MKFSKGDYFNYDGKKVEIVDLLGEGGQGEVYLAKVDNQSFAFKYYKEIPTDDFKFNLKNNIAKGSPSQNFLWPRKYIEFSDKSCGYLMDIRPKNYVSFISYLTGRNPFKNKLTMLFLCPIK